MMHNSYTSKVKLIFVPYLVFSLGLLSVLSLINWLLTMKFKLLDLKPIYMDFIIPSFIILGFIWFFLRPRFAVLKFDTNDENYKFITLTLSSIMLLLSASLIQMYLEDKTGQLTALKNINQIKDYKETRYYTIEDLYLDRDSTQSEHQFEVKGRGRHDFVMHIYIALPLYANYEESINLDTNTWYGLHYSETIPNKLPREDKSKLYQKFMDETDEEFNKSNLKNFTYLTRLNNSDEKDVFVNLIESNTETVNQKLIILTPHQNSFSERVIITPLFFITPYLISLIVLLLALYFADVNRYEYEQLKTRKKTTQFGPPELLMLLIPRKDFIATPTLVIANISVFIIMAISDGTIMNFNSAYLLHWGGNYIHNFNEGQWWRLITSSFIHAGAIHLLYNVALLYLIAAVLEFTLKPIRLIVFYIILAIAASGISLWWNDQLIIVGSSGAIFGLFGLYLSLSLTNIVSIEESKALAPILLFIIGFNIIVGLLGIDIDNAAHIGGLLSGFILGFMISPFIKNHNQDILK